MSATFVTAVGDAEPCTSPQSTETRGCQVSTTRRESAARPRVGYIPTSFESSEPTEGLPALYDDVSLGLLRLQLFSLYSECCFERFCLSRSKLKRYSRRFTVAKLPFPEWLVIGKRNKEGLLT